MYKSEYRLNLSSIWYGATVRGDVNKVTIGENTSIGDRAVVHVAKIQGNFMTNIGNNVTVEPGALIHAATVKDSCVVGASAPVMDGSVVETHSIIAPGSVVTPGTKVASGELWAGSPAKKVRALTADEIATIAETAMEKVEMASRHHVECSKDYKQLAEDIEQYEDDRVRDEDYWQQEASGRWRCTWTRFSRTNLQFYLDSSRRRIENEEQAVINTISQYF